MKIKVLTIIMPNGEQFVRAVPMSFDADRWVKEHTSSLLVLGVARVQEDIYEGGDDDDDRSGTRKLDS